jgi:hypothetical protein
MSDASAPRTAEESKQTRRKLTAGLKRRYACELARGDAARRAHIYAEIEEEVEREMRRLGETHG